MALEEYKDIVGSIAGILTIGQILSGVLTCKKIYSKGSTKNVPATMFLAGFVAGMVMFLQGLIIKDKAMKIITSTALSINVGYNIFYYLWSDKVVKRDYFKSFGKVLAIVLGVICYVQLENPEKLQFRYGVIATVVMFGFFAAPLFNIKNIMRTKNAETIPFAFAFSGALRSISWLLYGFIIKQQLIMFQNFVFLSLCTVQLALCFIYPSKPPSKRD